MMLNCLKNKDGFDTNCYNLSNFGTLYVMNYTQDVDDLRKLDEIRGTIIGWANADDYVASYNTKQGSIDKLSSGIDLANGVINLVL